MHKSENIEIMIEAVRCCIPIIENNFYCSEKKLDVQKKSSYNFVTNVDLLLEERLIKNLKSARPDYGILSEESFALINYNSYEYIWVIDPLDGTFNFMHNNPNYAITIALVKRNKLHASQVIASIIFLPALDQIYFSEKDVGAFCIEKGVQKSISVSKRIKFEEILLASGEKMTIPKKKLMNKINNKGLQFRITGSSAVDFAFTSCAKFDLLTQDGLSPWDVAPGLLLFREAGGIVFNFQGEHANIKDSDIIAVSPCLLNLLNFEEVIDECCKK